MGPWTRAWGSGAGAEAVREENLVAAGPESVAYRDQVNAVLVKG